MAMLPQLFSLSGLAVELNRDRRTIASALRNMRPDGVLPSGAPGFRLATALRALRGTTLAATGSEVSDPIASFLEDRLADPSLVTGGRMLMSLAEAARMLGEDEKTALHWLRAGAPFVSKGDWSTGTGFVIDFSHVVGWLILVAAHLAHIGRDDLHEALRLPGSTASL
jgi:hypothetical protein